MLLFLLVTAAFADDDAFRRVHIEAGPVIGVSSETGVAYRDSVTFGGGYQHRLGRSGPWMWEVDVAPITRTQTSLPIVLGYFGVGPRFSGDAGAVSPWFSATAGAGVLTILPVVGVDASVGLSFPAGPVDLDAAVRLRHLVDLLAEEGEYFGLLLPTLQVGARL